MHEHGAQQQVTLALGTIKWGGIEPFSMFFLNKKDCLDHVAPV